MTTRKLVIDNGNARFIQIPRRPKVDRLPTIAQALRRGMNKRKATKR